MSCCCSENKDLVGKKVSVTRRVKDLFKPVEKDVQLIQVQVLFRHGVRTPLTTAAGLQPAIYDVSLGDDLPDTLFTHYVINHKTGLPADESSLEAHIKSTILPGGCCASMLTTVGQKQMYTLGKELARYYLPALGIKEYSKDLVSIRSTHLNRTIKSMRCVLAGMFGAKHLEKVGPVLIPVKDLEEEDLFPNKLSCPALRITVESSVKRLYALPEQCRDRIKIIKALGLPPSAVVDFTNLRDDTRSRLEHGQEYPEVLLPFRQIIEKHAAKNVHSVYTGAMMPNSNDIIRLAIGRILYSLITKMEDCMLEKKPYKLRLLSSHDTALVPLMEVFGCWENAWPDFGANFSWELYKSRSNKGEFLVRTLFDGTPMILPGSETSLITFTAFKFYVQPFCMDKAQFTQRCFIHNQ